MNVPADYPRPYRFVTPMREEQRFWAKVDKRGPDECWPWNAGVNHSGYGHFYLQGHMQRAPRVAWALANGRDPGASYVCHSCDNPSCVNPAHLWLGSAADNARDMSAKGRAHKGQTHCKHGHEYTPENTYSRAEGWRCCRECRRAATRRHEAKECRA